ncbi:oxidoreductase [Bacillus coahuilensis m2-6]|uniref:SDR family NAD(P)-dependent oxidoreductase n=1 Tax=Bacillus coahuilensis TaxID=408580 RepID=UPI00018514B5|nr:SDR family oxidoreductase [Bacillus coahuilensis]KUP09532.1 oxidoreductase [Bacillus coahuilensis m2-6]
MFSESVVVITGSANGIGKEVARQYAEQGATLILVDRDHLGLAKMVKQLRKQTEVAEYCIDLQNVSAITETVEKVEKNFRKIDILINNAGISRFQSPYELSENEWDEIIGTNLKGSFFMARECAKVMKKHGGGKIINLSSTRALMSEPGGEAYGASKGGLLALTHSLAISLGSDHIQVNCISPGWIHTGDYEELSTQDHQQHPSGRVGKPSDIARACLFLTNPNNDFITGENIVIDGGMTKKMIYGE